MDFSKHLFRCSSLGHIMTDGRSKSEGLSETCKTHLVDVYVSTKYNRQTDIYSRYIQKGLMVEEDSITLYSRVKKNFFRKNEEHLTNDWIKGTPDLFTGEAILKAETIIDTKSSWDIFTFFRTHTKTLNKDYYWQLQGYMDLSGAKTSYLAYCLVDTPEVLINDEKNKLFWKMGVATRENTDYTEACDQLEKIMRYNDIPMNERVIEFEIKRNEEDIARLHKRVDECRKYLKTLDEVINPSIKKAA